MTKSALIAGSAAAALMMAAASGVHAQSWADNTTVTGRIYADMTNITTETDGVKKAGSAQGTGIDVKRFYIGIDHKFTDVFYTNVTLDADTVGVSGSGGNIGLTTYLKKAYLGAKFNPALDVKVGSSDLPWVPYAENIYGYRYFEKTLIDRASFGTSADWGVHVSGDLPGGIFSYQVSAINGNGYRQPARQKGLDLEGRLSAKIQQWNFAVGAYDGTRGQAIQGTSTPQHAKRFNALAAFVGDRTRVGVEAFTATNWTPAAIKDTAPTFKDLKSEGQSVFGSYRVTPQYAVFGRFDTVKPTKSGVVGGTTQDTAARSELSTLGVQWSAFKNVDFALAGKHSVDKKTSSTPGVLTKTVADEIGVWAQLRY